MRSQIDESNLNAFTHQVVADMGATVRANLIVIGDKLGLYKAMAGAGRLTSAELAARTGTTERYVCEWRNANAASGYLTSGVSSGEGVEWHEHDANLFLRDRALLPAELCGQTDRVEARP